MKNKKIKNVIIINDFNYVQGGASKVAIDTAEALKNKGINVIFFSAVNQKEANIKGVTYISTNQCEALKEKNKLKGVINGIYNFKAKKELKKLLKTLDKEETIIHIHGWTKALSSSVFDIAFKMNFKVVLTLHDYFSACPNGGYFNYKENQICYLKPLSWKCIKCNCDSRNYAFKLYRLIRQFVQNKVVKLNEKLEYAISISEFSEKILKSTLGKNTKIIRIYNPIDINKNIKKIDPTTNKYYLYVGRIVKEKGVDLFCKAITDLKYKGVVVGDGTEKEELERGYPNIEFTGWKNTNEVEEYMKGSKALIFPSRWYETAGLTVLEAQVLGVPSIVNKNCAASEFINEGVNGFLFDDINTLKEKIIKIENEKIKVQKNNEFIFGIEKYANELMEAYRKIMK